VADDGVVGGRLTDWVSLGVLASWVPRDAVDDAVAETGRAARRAGGKLPPHVVVYLVMALALFADDDYEEVAARLTGTLAEWGCWDQSWQVPTSGGITQARQRLGAEPLAELFARVAVPVAGEDTAGAFLGPWRLMAIDGFEWDVPATPENVAAFGFHGASSGGQAAFPKARVVTVSECGSHAVAGAAIGGTMGKGSGEQTLARQLYPRLEQDWLLLADRGFYNWKDWCTAADTGAALLWRVRSPYTRLPVLEVLPDGSYRSVLILPKLNRESARRPLIAAARRDEALDPALARYIRVIEYEIPDRTGNGKGDVVTLITTITSPAHAAGPVLAQAYHQRWEHETGNQQLKTYLRGPGRVLRSGSPDLVRQEIYGYLLTHYAISALTCAAATAAGIDPDRVKFRRTVRIVRRRVTDPAFSP
jgi:Insertion element 4 transposase N-terminal